MQLVGHMAELNHLGHVHIIFHVMCMSTMRELTDLAGSWYCHVSDQRPASPHALPRAITVASLPVVHTSACDIPAIQTERSGSCGHRQAVTHTDSDPSGHPDRLCPSRWRRGQEAARPTAPSLRRARSHSAS